MCGAVEAGARLNSAHATDGFLLLLHRSLSPLTVTRPVQTIPVACPPPATHPTLPPPPLLQTNVPGATRIRVERSALTSDNGKLTFETVDLNTYQLYSVRLTAVGYGSVFSTWSTSALAGERKHLGAEQHSCGWRLTLALLAGASCRAGVWQPGPAAVQLFTPSNEPCPRCPGLIHAGMPSPSPSGVVLTSGASTLRVNFTAAALLSDTDTVAYKLYTLGATPQLVGDANGYVVPR